MNVKSPSFARHVYYFVRQIRKKKQYKKTLRSVEMKIGNFCSRYKTCFPIDCRVQVEAATNSKSVFSRSSRPYETQFTPLTVNTVCCEAHFVLPLTQLPLALRFLTDPKYKSRHIEGSQFLFCVRRPVCFFFVQKKKHVFSLCFPMICRTMKALG